MGAPISSVCPSNAQSTVIHTQTTAPRCAASRASVPNASGPTPCCVTVPTLVHCAAMVVSSIKVPAHEIKFENLHQATSQSSNFPFDGDRSLRRKFSIAPPPRPPFWDLTTQSTSLAFIALGRFHVPPKDISCSACSAARHRLSEPATGNIVPCYSLGAHLDGHRRPSRYPLKITQIAV